MLGAFSIDAYLPSFHAIGRDLKIDRVAVQQTLTIYLFCFALMMLFYGTLSDTFGRRRVILGSVMGYVAGSVCAAIAPGFGWLLAARALQGLSAGAGSVVGRAIVRDLFPGHEGQKMMGYIMMVFSIAPAVAPVIGGWLEVYFGWRSVFVFLAGISFLILVLALKFLPESLPVEQRQPLHLGTILKTYWKVGAHGPFILQSLGIAMMFGGFSVYISTAPDFVMHVLHLPETAFAWLFVPIISGMCGGSWASAKLAARVASEKLIWRAYAITATAAVVNVLYAHLFVSSVPWAVIMPMFYMFGLAMAAGAMAMRVMDLFPEARGMAASLQGFVQMMLFAAVAGLVAPLVFGSATKLAWSALIGCGLSAGFWWLGTRGVKKG